MVAFRRIFDEVFVRVVMGDFPPIFQVFAFRRERGECALGVKECLYSHRFRRDEYVIGILGRFNSIASTIRSFQRARSGQYAREFFMRRAFIGPAIFTRVRSLVKDMSCGYIVRWAFLFRMVRCTAGVIVR